MQEMQIWCLGQEYPLEEEMATPSCILAWEVTWREEPGGHSPWSRKELDMPEATNIFPFTERIKLKPGW